MWHNIGINQFDLTENVGIKMDGFKLGNKIKFWSLTFKNFAGELETY